MARQNDITKGQKRGQEGQGSVGGWKKGGKREEKGRRKNGQQRSAVAVGIVRFDAGAWRGSGYIQGPRPQFSFFPGHTLHTYTLAYFSGEV